MAGRRRRGGRCRYYVNTNFFIDLEEGRRETIEFARRYQGRLCTSRILVREYAAVNRQGIARRLAELYGVAIYKVPVSSLLERARRVLRSWGVERPSDSSVADVAHMLAARMLGASYFVTGDRRACRRAIRLGLSCINHRSGEYYAPP